MHEILFRRQKHLADSDLRRSARDGTPTLFINGVVHRGDYDAATLIEAINSATSR